MRHTWADPIRYDPHSTVRTCRRCALVRITRHEPENFPPHWVEFERDGFKVETVNTPSCIEAPQQHQEAAE